MVLIVAESRNYLHLDLKLWAETPNARGLVRSQNLRFFFIRGLHRGFE